MCGIAGIVRFTERPVDADALIAMRDVMTHRGPDDCGLYLEPWVGLAHRRLSIIDLSPAGHQPMCNEDGTIWVVFNGEIYNFEPLRRELAAKGHRFLSGTDTEVILHAYEEWGERCLDRFNGMWAFAVWDQRRQELFCARDRSGVKPFYYYADENFLAFASEIKGLLAHPHVPRQLNRASLYRLLKFGLMDTGTETCFEGIRQLLPGHRMTVRDGRVETRPYWQPPDTDLAPIEGTDESFADRFRALLEESIQLRLRSDVPVGACLSGGLDSSALVALASRRLPGPLRTFTVSYPGTPEDENRFVEAVIRNTGKLEPHVQHPDGSDLFDIFQRAIWHFDEPIWSSSVYSWFQVMKQVKDHGVTVVLNGQGADELLAGYPIYYPTYLRQLLRTGKLRTFRDELKCYARVMGLSRSAALRYLVTPFWPSSLRRLTAGLGLSRSFDESFLHPDFCRLGSVIDDADGVRHYRRYTRLNEHLRDEFRSARLPMLLHAEDRFSMAFSLESRVPFLDYRLVEFALRLPDEQKLRRGMTKGVLRRAMADVLPQNVLERSDKKGYPTPATTWLREALVEPAADLIHSRSFEEHGIFRADQVRERFEQFRRGRISLPQLPCWLGVELWLQTFLDEPTGPVSNAWLPSSRVVPPRDHAPTPSATRTWVSKQASSDGPT